MNASHLIAGFGEEEKNGKNKSKISSLCLNTRVRLFKRKWEQKVMEVRARLKVCVAAATKVPQVQL